VRQSGDFCSCHHDEHGRVEAVNALYDVGVFVVTAAGNNFANLPTREVVYPARFARVVAACGVMANQAPYADLAPTLMAGNYGPLSKMKTAVAAFTPNTPWARFGASGIVDFDGNGTSAATPQVAAAAALWIQKNRAAYDKYPQAWMRVEAVRKALFDGAHAENDEMHFGRGRLAALDMLGKAPAKADQLRDSKLPPDSASFPVVSVLTGLGVAADAGPRRTMLELEALQVVGSMRLETPIPDGAIDPRTAVRIAEELLSKPGLSTQLRKALEGGAGGNGRGPIAGAGASVPPKSPSGEVDALHLKLALDPVPPIPVVRRLRIYAYDPSLASDLANFSANNATISIRWEKDLKPGPVGEYLEVVDIDPASSSCYVPVDLNHPHLLSENGLPPSEANPQFH
jgi:Subtilase family